MIKKGCTYIETTFNDETFTINRKYKQLINSEFI